MLTRLTLLGLLALAGCANVSTGQRSDCFGRTDIEGDFVTRSLALAAVAPVSSGHGGAHECDFQDL